MKKLTTGTSSIFVNPTFTIQINPTLEIDAELQVICWLGKDGWTYDAIEASDIIEIRYSGFVIRDFDKIRAFTNYHKEIGIDVWQTICDEAGKMVRSYTVREFIKLFTPLELLK
tara:strand:+ start:1866 stop:2207 length:342 start_codon:yes stop_codon:yes gene_type:complete